MALVQDAQGTINTIAAGGPALVFDSGTGVKGAVQIELDLSLMGVGDVLTVAIAQNPTALTGDGVVQVATFTGPQTPETAWASDVFLVFGDYNVTLDNTGAGNVNVDYKALRAAG